MNSLNTRLAPGPMSDRTGAIAADLIRRYGMPDRLLDKSAAEIFEGTPIRTGYADTAKTYPVHSPSSAWLSAAAYHDTASSDPVVGNRIKEACEWFGVGSEWDRLEAIRPKEASAPPVKTWALPHCQKYPLDTEGQVKSAANYFEQWADRFSDEDRRIYAEQLVKAADVFPSAIDADRLWRFEAEAGLGLPTDNWKTEFSVRAKKARQLGATELADAIDKAAADAEESINEFGTFRNAGELANMWKKLDDRFKWGQDDPLRGMVSMTPSMARLKLASAVKAASGNWYLKSDLDRVPDEACFELCGMGPVVSLQAKVAAVSDPSSPFEKLARSMGVEPIERAPQARVDWKAESKEAFAGALSLN